jgi:hypothetical protein
VTVWGAQQGSAEPTPNWAGFCPPLAGGEIWEDTGAVLRLSGQYFSFPYTTYGVMRSINQLRAKFSYAHVQFINIGSINWYFVCFAFDRWITVFVRCFTLFASPLFVRFSLYKESRYL